MSEEGGTAPRATLRRFPRSLVIVVFGPLVGALAAFVYFLVLDLIDAPPADDFIQAAFSLFAITVVTGWVTGLPAAAISALAWHFLEPRLGTRLRLPAALAIGALTSISTTLPIVLAVFGRSVINANGILLVGAIGALALAVTALPGQRSA